MFIVGADNVGSKQMQQIRSSLRGSAGKFIESKEVSNVSGVSCIVVLMGKNTMIRKAIRGHLDKNPQLEKLLPHIKGNIGFVFTKLDLKEVRDNIQSNQVGCSHMQLRVTV